MISISCLEIYCVSVNSTVLLHKNMTRTMSTIGFRREGFGKSTLPNMAVPALRMSKVQNDDDDDDDDDDEEEEEEE